MLTSEPLMSDANVAAHKEDVTGDCQVQPVTSSVAPKIWSIVLPFIERARAGSPDYIAKRERGEDILAKIEGGQYQLWLTHRGGQISSVSVTSIEKMSRASVCVIQYQSGADIDEWFPVFKDEIQGWARENGCVQMQVAGREGWGRKLAPHGLKRGYTVFVAEL